MITNVKEQKSRTYIPLNGWNKFHGIALLWCQSCIFWERKRSNKPGNLFYTTTFKINGLFSILTGQLPYFKSFTFLEDWDHHGSRKPFVCTLPFTIWDYYMNSDRLSELVVGKEIVLEKPQTQHADFCCRKRESTQSQDGCSSCGDKFGLIQQMQSTQPFFWSYILQKQINSYSSSGRKWQRLNSDQLQKGFVYFLDYLLKRHSQLLIILFAINE
jgi:hypothetical protein